MAGTCALLSVNRRVELTDYLRPTGGATLTKPASGWSDPDLEVYFGRKYTPATRTATCPVPTSGSTSTPTASSPASTQKKAASLSVGAIAGIAVGAIAVIAAILALVWAVMRKQRSKRKAQTANGSHPPPTMVEHPSDYSPWSPHSDADVRQKRAPSGSTVTYTSGPGSPPPQFHSGSWSHSPPPPDWRPVPAYGGSEQNQYHGGQAYYPPPPQPQQYYPPPPGPRQYDPPTLNEMPSFSSPVNAADARELR